MQNILNTLPKEIGYARHPRELPPRFKGGIPFRIDHYQDGVLHVQATCFMEGFGHPRGRLAWECFDPEQLQDSRTYYKNVVAHVSAIMVEALKK